MIVYFLLLCSVICSSIFVSFSKDKGAVLVSKCITFNLIFIPAAFRYGIGADYFDYVDMFNGISNGNYEQIELGWRYLNLIVYKLGGSAQFLIALVAFLSLFFLFVEVEDEKWFIYAPICIVMIYMWMFTTLRQMLAMSMVFCGVQRVKKNKYVYALILFFLSFFIHKSVVMYIPIFCFCFFIRFKPFTAVILYFITIVVTNFYFTSINNILFNLIGMGQYSNYLTSDWIDGTDPGMGRFIRYLVHSVMLFFFPVDNDKEKSALLTLFLLYCMIDCYSLNIQIINRVSRGIIFLFMPLMWEVWKFKPLRQIRIFIYVVCFLLLFLRNYNGAEYISIFN